MTISAQVIDTIVEWIDDNLHQPLRIDDIARHAGYSKWHLQRLFLQYKGESLGRYIRERKLLLAARDLRDTDQRVYDICLKYGFDSQQTFTRVFTRLAFFSGKRCVAIIAGLVSIVVSAVLLFVWPLLFSALVALGDAVAGMGVVGAGIYAFLNRLLIPTGLHHALNNVFWFDTIGLGDLQHFWAGETSADVTWSLGMYMSGFFPCMMFGIPGAALAMIQCAKPAKKKIAIGLVASAAVCSFVCGVTEPFEFGFMFLAPGLYVIYALLYGIFTIVTVALGFRAGFSFSAGATDLLFSSTLPAAQKTVLIIPLGIAAFVVFYFVFLFAIKKFDLKTPGREDDDLEEEKNVQLASDDYTEIAKKILAGCGGKGNIVSIDNCVTRLRLEVRDMTAVNDKAIKAAGVAGVIKPGKTSVQVIVGTKVQFVADAFSKLCE